MRSQNSEVSSITATFHDLFQHEGARRRHIEVLWLEERAAYLAELLKNGFKRRFVSERASMLLHVVRLFGDHQGKITESHMADVGVAWAAERANADSRKTVANFKAVARSWFRHLERYDQDARHGFDSALGEFGSALTTDFGYRVSTKECCLSAVSRFRAALASLGAGKATLGRDHDFRAVSCLR